MCGLASIVTLYQAGNGIYDLFDKVLVLDEGKEIYYGPMKEARPFMENLGFICQPGANVADYLTSVTVPDERAVRPEMEAQFPRTAEGIRTEYLEDAHLRAYDFRVRLSHNRCRQRKHQAVSRERPVREGQDAPLSTSPLTVGFLSQVKACVQRQ